MEGRTKTSSSGAISKISLPFYEPPLRKTSADIINEARASLRESQMVDSGYATSIKPIQTKRPFTPREKERILFGHKAKSNRPPSSFSLRYLQTEADEIPNAVSTISYSTKNGSNFRKQRSNSLTTYEENKLFDVGISKIRLPALSITKHLQRKKYAATTYSLDNLPEEPAEDYNVRKAFSSPQERTEYSDSANNNSPFGRPSQQQSLSQCLLLGPQNLFENKQIVENSDTLFIKTGYINNAKMENIKKSCTVDKNLNQCNDNSVENIIVSLNEVAKKINHDGDIIHLLDKLYDCVGVDNYLSTNGKMKITILKCLYKFVESQNEKLLLGIARIILALKVTGNNLSGVCKLIFKVAKSDKNDYLFLEKNILELFVDALGRCSPLDDGEACVYGYGAVKFLTMNPTLLEKILKFGTLQLMILHIKIINNAKEEKIQIPEQTEHALFQLTGALRNIASDENVYSDFIANETIFYLCQTIDLFSANLDIVSNISRTLSTISTNDDCCDKISEYKGIYRIFVKLFDKYPGNDEIIVRLAYTLGNILAKLDNARVKFYQEKNSINSLIELWKIYLDRTLKTCSLKVEDEVNYQSNTEDVMIKIIRVIANIAINTEMGKAMNDKYGMQLIDEFLKVLISNPFKKNDELVLSVLSTLNNLSYYYTVDFDRDIFNIKQIDIIEAITEYVTNKNADCVIEAIRILGNLSRSKITRKYVSESDLFINLIKMLDKDDINILKTTIGVFVNLMADNKNRSLFKTNRVVSKLISILNSYGTYDWTLSMLLCQVIWNLCIDTLNLYEIITDYEMQQLLGVLADALDEERLFDIQGSSEELEVYTTQEYMVWEEFANVATNLLEKIEHFLDALEQLELEVNNEPKTKDSSTNLSFSAW